MPHPQGGTDKVLLQIMKALDCLFMLLHTGFTKLSSFVLTDLKAQQTVLSRTQYALPKPLLNESCRLLCMADLTTSVILLN